MFNRYRINKLNRFWGASLLPLYYEKFPIVLCYSAKCGCTTALRWFLEQNCLLEEAIKFDPWIHNYREKVLQSQKNYKQQCMDIFLSDNPGKIIIKVIRDPMKRAVSSYLHYLRCETTEHNWVLVEKVQQWKHETGLSYQKGISFIQFLKFIKAEKNKKEILDPHISVQYQENQDPKVHEYILIENLDVRLKEIELKYNLRKTNIASLSYSSHHNIYSDSHLWPEDAYNYPADHDDIVKLGVPNSEIFVDPKTEVLIEDIYKKDVMIARDLR
jgi:hypothetical protein